MKVEEAKYKLCPLISSFTEPAYLVCEGGGIEQNTSFCKANACMSWRWCDPDVKNDGYCGLAGKEGTE